jgi:hypothetical protein
MKKIIAKTIPNEKQRYPTPADYIEKKDQIQFRISEIGEPDYEFLLFLHELIEHHLCVKRGIKMEHIDAFDINFERERSLGKHPEDAEPGFDPNSPYVKEHTFADKIERMVAQELGVNWEEYNETVINL